MSYSFTNMAFFVQPGQYESRQHTPACACALRQSVHTSAHCCSIALVSASSHRRSCAFWRSGVIAMAVLNTNYKLKNAKPPTEFTLLGSIMYNLFSTKISSLTFRGGVRSKVPWTYENPRIPDRHRSNNFDAPIH